MHNEDLDNLYSLPHSVKVKLKKNELGWVCGTHTLYSENLKETALNKES
jgi:hypothetical protein